MMVLQQIYGWIWGVPALILVISIGLLLSLRTGFAQLRLLPRSCRMFVSRLLGRQSDHGGVSSFQALCTALAATVGTGNLAGVAGAIAIGGPGAVFWMWLCGILGMIIKCAEAALAVHFRQRNEAGEWVGGPMYMIAKGLPGRLRFLAGIYAFFGVIASLGVGNATQINTLFSGLENTAAVFGWQFSAQWKGFLALALAGLMGLLLSGGARRIGAVAERMIPLLALVYLVLGVSVLFLRREAVPGAFSAIFHGAFSPRAVTGGAVGSVWICLRTGVSRGVFTNEAGMGTASIAHASASVSHPMEQGLMGIMEVFLDTMVICTMTALVILCAGVPIAFGEDAGIGLTADAFSDALGPWAGVAVALSACLFALATVLGWGFYGLRCAQYLFGQRVLAAFVALQMVAVMTGALLRADMIWLVAEIINGAMLIPNLTALWVLLPEFTKLYKSYLHGGTYENFHQCESL